MCFNMVSFRGQKRLGHAQIGLLYGFNSKFPTSLPTPFICGVSPPPPLGFPREMTSRNERRNSTMTMCHYLGTLKIKKICFSSKVAIQPCRPSANVRFSPFWSHLSTISAKTA